MNGHNESLTISLDDTLRESLYQRLLKGEKWKALAAIAGCTGTGLRSCFRRAGYDLRIRAIRRGEIGKTRNIEVERTAQLHARYLSMPLRVSHD